MRESLTVGIAVMVACSLAAGQIIDHTDIDGVSSLPQSVMDAVGEQKWFFAHASVGLNMLQGMSSLHSADPGRYQLTDTAVGFSSSDPDIAAAPPAPTQDGTIYEWPRGNPSWSEKFARFAASVETSGWHSPSVDVCMDKLCFIDLGADAAVYIASMTALEVAYPDTVFVYTTEPLVTLESGLPRDEEMLKQTNVHHHQYNEAVRAHCQGNGGILLDIADIEAYDPDGNYHSFEYSGQIYPQLYVGYAGGLGHLTAPGRERVALAWYATAVAAAYRMGLPGDTDLDGDVDLDDLFAVRNAFGTASGAAGHQGDTDGDGDVDLDDLFTVRNYFGAGSVPEPATATLWVVCGASLLFRRGRAKQRG